MSTYSLTKREGSRDLSLFPWAAGGNVGDVGAVVMPTLHASSCGRLGRETTG